MLRHWQICVYLFKRALSLWVFLWPILFKGISQSGFSFVCLTCLSVFADIVQGNNSNHFSVVRFDFVSAFGYFVQGNHARCFSFVCLFVSVNFVH